MFYNTIQYNKMSDYDSLESKYLHIYIVYMAFVLPITQTTVLMALTNNNNNNVTYLYIAIFAYDLYLKIP